MSKKGFREVQGVDYNETFSPIAMLKSVRIMLAIAAFYDYQIWKLSGEGVSLERSEWEESRKLDKVIVPSPLLESSSSQKSVPVIPTPISEEANDDDHETSDQVNTKSRR